MRNIIRASRSHIPRMRLSITSRLASIIFLALLCLPVLTIPGWAQNFAGGEEQLARKIVATTGQKTMAVEVVNRSSLSANVADDIRRNLLTQLAVLGARFVATDQASVNVRVSLSENLLKFDKGRRPLQSPWFPCLALLRCLSKLR
jgi:hypothetical protein